MPSASWTMPVPVSPSVSVKVPKLSQVSPKTKNAMRIQRGITVLEG